MALTLTGTSVLLILFSRYLFNIREVAMNVSTIEKVGLGFVRLFIGISFNLWIADKAVRYLNKHITYKRIHWQRWALQGLLIITIAFLLSIFESVLSQFLPHRQGIKANFFLIAFVFNFILLLLTFSITEAWDIAVQNNQLRLSLSLAEKEKVASQLTALQQKVNPHFLFNSLNVLSELIYDDPKRAEMFIREFANVYRYVLDLNDERVVTVKQELEFLKSYLFLQKIRFGDNLQIEQQLSVDVLEQLIPPLSLQLLFENAIKHNRVSKTDPLHISLYHDQQFLIVTNPLQRRKDNIHSKGLGLANLRKKYELISNITPQFYATESAFIAKIPFIAFDI